MTLAHGTRLGRYEIRSQLGAGGMGEVYLAQDTSELERTVAIKLLPAEVASNQQRMQRFVQEARTVSALNHPNILTIYEFGQADAVRFIATEYVNGITLREHMSGRRMKLHEVLDVAMQVAGALDAAHEAKVVHRDIKPDNIMIRRDHIVKVLDFGLAKPVDKIAAPQPAVDSEAGTKLLVHTEPGLVMGTVSYMSPEQSQAAARVDHRTDIWSLGVLLFEMVTGRLPFEGKDVHRQIIAIQESAPPPLSRYTEEAPERLEEIVAKALAKDVDERYQTAKDLLIDLRNLNRKLDVEAEIERTYAPDLRTATGDTRPSGRYAARTASQPAAHAAAVGHVSTASSAEYLVREIKSHKRSAAAVLGVFVLALVTGGYFLFFPRGAKAIDSIAVLPLANASGDPNSDYLSDGISESLINNLTQIPKLRVLARSTVFRYKGKEVDPQKVGRELGVRAVLTGRVQQRGDNLVIQADLIDVSDGSELWGEQYNRSMSDLVAVQQDIAREITSKLKLRLSGEEEKQLARRDTSNTEAYQLYLKGRFYWNKRTADGLKTAIDYYNQAIEKDPNYALAYAGLASTYVIFAEYSGLPAKDYQPKAEAAAKKALEIDETLSEAHAVLAAYKLNYEWDWAGAEREFKRAIELNPNYPTTHHWYSILLSSQGRFDEALAEIKRAQELDPLSLIINENVADAYAAMRQYDKAVNQYQKTLELDPNFPGAHVGLGTVYSEQGKFDDAIREFQKARTLAGNSPFGIVDLGYVYARAGKRSDALQILNQLLELAKQGHSLSYQIAFVYAGLGDKDQAFEWLNKAYDEHNEQLRGLKIFPEWDPLRSDPRFADLLRHIGLPP